MTADRLIAIPIDPSGAAVHGGYFAAAGPTLGTGIVAATATRTTYSVDEAMLLADFPATAVGAVMLPDFIRLVCTAPGAGYTSLHMALVLSQAVRFASLGDEITGAKNVHLHRTSAPEALWWMHGGDLTLAAAVSPRQVARFVAKGAILAANDELVLSFGGKASGAIQVPPVVLGAGTSMALHCWGPAMTEAPSFEVSMGWREQAG